METSSSDQRSQRLLIPVMLGGHHRLNALVQLARVSDILESVAWDPIQDFQRLFGCGLIPMNNITWVKTLLEKRLSLAQEFPRQNNHEVSPVSDFLLLLLCRHHHHACGWMVYFHLLHNRCCVTRHELLFQVVNHQLVHAYI